jgi:hypothetical protein
MKWVNSISSDDTEYSSDYFKSAGSVILLADCTRVAGRPICTTKIMARSYVNNDWEGIFERELSSWNNDETLWPKNRTRKIFWQWFDIEFCPIVFDEMQ